MARKKQISELSQTHGKVEDFKPTTLDQIWGDDGLSKYQTLDEVQYRNFLSGMNRSDLHAHCSKAGIIPIDNRDLLERKLIGEFQKYVSSYRAPNQKKIESNISKEAIEILKEGKQESLIREGRDLPLL